MRGNCLQHSHSVTFPSVHSQFHSHDASHLIPIPVPLPEFIPIPSHCHSRLTNERPLSLNNQTTINVKKQTFNCFSLKNRNSKSHIVSYRWIIKMRTFKMQKKMWRYNILLDCIFVESTVGNFGTREKVSCTVPIFICGIFVFPFPWDSHENPIPMHLTHTSRTVH